MTFNVMPRPAARVNVKSLRTKERTDTLAKNWEEAKRAAETKRVQDNLAAYEASQKSPTISYKPLKSPGKKKKKSTLPGQVKDLSSNELINGNFKPESMSGISVFRPEIISVLNYQPIFSGNPELGHLTPHGRLLEVSYQASLLRRDRLAKLYKSLLETSGDKIEAQAAFSRLKKNFAIELSQIKDTASFYADALDNIDALTDFFDLKKISENKQTIDGAISLKKFYKQYMGFSESQFNKFTGSKILLQFLADLKALTENYSFQLLDITDSDRRRDSSPVAIDTTYTIKDGFTFTLANVRSEGSPKNAMLEENFQPFQTALPGDAKKRIKILMTLLSKEYTVSAAMGTRDVKNSLRENFGAEDFGNPFDNILGVIGKSIFVPTKGSDAFAALVHQPIVGGVPKIPGSTSNLQMTVLPFEAKHIDDIKHKRTFIPGKSYYINTIFDIGTSGDETDFNTGPLIEYVNSFSDKFIKVQQAYGDLLGHSLELAPDTICNRFLNSVKFAIGNINARTRRAEAPPDFSTASIQAVVIAIFKLAHTDPSLKQLLFQYILGLGLLQNTHLDPKSIWSSLALELGDISAFPGIKIPDGNTANTSLTADPNAIKGSMNQIIKAMDRRIKILVGGGSPISDKLISNLLLRLVDGATSNMEYGTNGIQECINLINKITEAARTFSGDNYLLKDSTGRTRYNFISTSTQMLMIFETFSSLLKLFGSSEFKKITTSIARVDGVNASGFGISTNSETNIFIAKTITKTVGAIFDGETPPAVRETNTEFGPDQGSPVPNIPDFSGLAGAVAALTGGKANPGKKKEKSTKEKNLEETMRDIKSKVNLETTIIATSLYLLSTIKDRLESAKTLALSTYNPETLKSFLVDENTLKDLRVIKNEAQVRNSYSALRDASWRVNHSLDKADPELDDLKGRRGDNAIVLNIVDEKTKEAVYSMLAQKEFRQQDSSTKIKIMTIGIPVGFIKNLIDRLDAEKIKSASSFRDKELDVIQIKIYKRSLVFDDLVFKPKKFLFDLSLYQHEKDLVKIAIRAGTSFDSILNKNILSDLARPKHPEAYTKESIVDLDQYSFLSRNEKRRMFENHFNSFLWETYIKLATGMSINETTFIEDADIRVSKKTDNRIEKILKSYLTDILQENIPRNQSTEELLANPEVREEVKDILRDFKSGNITFAPKQLRDRILAPKLFDRVFHIPIDIDKDFEVDLEATKDTPAGRTALKQKYIKDMLVTREDGGKEHTFLKPRTDRDIIFEDFFVVVETKD